MRLSKDERLVPPWRLIRPAVEKPNPPAQSRFFSQWRLSLFCTSTIRHGRQALNQNRPGGSYAVSNYDRRLLAPAGMAGRAEHALGALAIKGRRARPSPARRTHAGRDAAGGWRRRF